MFKIIRTIVLILWVVSIIWLWIYIYSHKGLLEPEQILAFLRSFGSWALILYILISFIRGLVLLPSLPLVLVGMLFFPDSPFLVFIISMLGIVFSGALIYGFSDVMWFDEFFAKHLETQKFDRLIEQYGFPIIVIWSFAPVVMTDLICYVAGTVRYPFWKFLIALTIGESIMVAILIYWGRELLLLLWMG